MPETPPSFTTSNESNLHAAIKDWYAVPGDLFEEKVDGSVIDLVRDGVLIEIQTKNFYAIRKKLVRLLKNHRVRLVHPISKEKWISRFTPGASLISRRRSSRPGKLIDIFDELVRIPDLVGDENFSLDVLMIRDEEVRCDDGKGSWRRKGVSVTDRVLLEVCERHEFRCARDFLSFIPESVLPRFTNRSLAQAHRVPAFKARRATYCMKKMGLIEVIDKNRNEQVFELSEKYR